MEIKIGEKVDYEVDLKKIITVFYRFRWMIISISLLGALLAATIAFFKPNIYSATTTVEVQVRSWFSFGDKDPRAAALTGEMASNINTEIEILKSRYVTARALKKVDFSHRYYVEDLLKERELYKSSPFTVELKRGYGRSFFLYPIDDESFKLETSIVTDGEDKVISHIYRYGESISTLFYELNITKNTENQFSYDKYRFTVLDPQSLPQRVVGGVSVATVSRRSTVLGVTYSGIVPERVKEFSIALAEVYLEQNVERRTWEATQTIILIDKQLKKIKQKIEEITKKIEKFRRETQTVDIERRTEKLSDQLSDFETQMMTIELQEQMLSRYIQRVKDGKSLETMTLAGLGLEDDTLFELLKDFRELMVKKRELTRDYTAVHPLVKKVDYKIRTMMKIILEAMNNIYTGIVEKEKFIKKQMKKIENILAKLPETQRRYLTLQRSFKANETFYEYLLEKRTEAEIRKTSNMNLNRIIDKALLPGGVIAPKRKLYILIGLFIGFIIAVIIAFIRDILDDKIKTEDELKSMTNIPMLGTVPHFNFREDDKKLIVNSDPKSVAAEAFRSIRTNLKFISPVDKGMVIAVTSTIQGEGKTIITTNLASIIALTGKKVLLMSIDMRRPAIHRIFGLHSGDAGLSNLLSGHSSVNEVIHKDIMENLDLITSGPKPPNPSELLGNELFLSFIDEMKQRYDFIIMDTPPVGPVTDTKLILPYCDIVTYILRAGYSRKNFIVTMEEIYSEHGKHGMGFVLNDFDVVKHGYGYKYGYGYSYAAKYRYYYGEDEKKSFFSRIFGKKHKKRIK